MPQWRKLHVKAVESWDINAMPDDFHRLLWVMLPLGLCREGRGIDNPAWIKAKIMPLRLDVTAEMIEAAMDWYAGHDMIERYEVDGRRFFWVRTFRHYQGNTSKEAASPYPAPPPTPEQPLEDDAPTPDLLQTYSRPTPDQRASRSGTDADAEAEEMQMHGAASAASPQAHHHSPDGDIQNHALAEVMEAWENVNPRRQVTALDAERLGDLCDDYGPQEVLVGIRACNEYGKPHLAYLSKVLRNRANPNARARASPPGNGQGDEYDLTKQWWYDRTTEKWARGDEAIGTRDGPPPPPEKWD
jgi:hypothetical protein